MKHPEQEETPSVKTKVEVAVGNLTAGIKGMFKSPDEPGWIEEWTELGEGLIQAYSRGSGRIKPSSPSSE